MTDRSSSADDRCRRLAEVLAAEIPLAGQMGVGVEAIDSGGLRVSMPLGPNRNPHQTAFAGSLNALCTLAGWAMTHVLLEELGLAGATVIRRSSIKYHRPVRRDPVVACCLPLRERDHAFFAEMVAAKGQGKLDHVVQIDAEP
ncbi:MAG: YiiD C-terminal domain-containing protein, partial [Planctomycetota bacterium]